MFYHCLHVCQDNDIGLLLRNLRRRVTSDPVVQNVQGPADKAAGPAVVEHPQAKEQHIARHREEYSSLFIQSAEEPYSMAEIFPSIIRPGIEHWMRPLRAAMMKKRVKLPKRQRKKAKVQLGCGGAAPEAWLHEDKYMTDCIYVVSFLFVCGSIHVT